MRRECGGLGAGTSGSQARPAMRYVKRRVGCSFLFLRCWLALGRFLFCKLTVPPASSTCYPHMCFTVPDDLFVCPEEERAHPFCYEVCQAASRLLFPLFALLACFGTFPLL